LDGQEVPPRNAIAIAVRARARRVGRGIESRRFQFRFGLGWPRASNWIDRRARRQIVHFFLFDSHATFSCTGHWHEAGATTLVVAVIGLWVQRALNMQPYSLPIETYDAWTQARYLGGERGH